MARRKTPNVKEETSDFKEVTSDIEEETTSVVKVEEMSLDEIQLAEQLYYSAGLDPIVDAGIKDFAKKVQTEDKLINKVFGIRGSDIRGYSESVARRVAVAVYDLLNRQYGGKVGDLRSYVMSLEEDRDHANLRYDELMGRVIGILGDEYKELRTDSKEFIEKLTKTLGDDLKDAKIDQKALAERLADIDGLRAQIVKLNKEKEQSKEKHDSKVAELNNNHRVEINNLKSQIDNLQKEKDDEKGKYEASISSLNNQIIQEKEKSEARIIEMKNDYKEQTRNYQSQIDNLNKEMIQNTGRYESQIGELKSNHKDEINNLKSQIAELINEKEQDKVGHEAQFAEMDSTIKGLETDKDNLISDLEQLKKDYDELKTTISKLAESIPEEGMGKKCGEEQYDFILKDSKVPSAVLKGVGQFIDLRKYLGLAVEKGAKEIRTSIEKILETARSE